MNGRLAHLGVQKKCYLRFCCARYSNCAWIAVASVDAPADSKGGSIWIQNLNF